MAKGFSPRKFAMIGGTAVVAVALFNTLAASKVGGKVPGVRALSGATGGKR